MTNIITTSMDPTELASKLAQNDDRFAFFVSLILLGLSGIWLVRWLIGQNQKLADTLNNSHAAYEGKLEIIVAKQNDLISASTEARVAHTEAIRENSEILRKNSDTLNRAQEVLIKHGHTAAMLVLMPFTLLGSGCAPQRAVFEERGTNGVVRRLSVSSFALWPATASIAKQRASMGKTWSFGAEGIELDGGGTNVVEAFNAAARLVNAAKPTP